VGAQRFGVLRGALAGGAVVAAGTQGTQGVGGQGCRGPGGDRFAGNGVQRCGRCVFAGAPARGVAAVLPAAPAAALAPAARPVDDL
jgi:hypothetical protein